MSGHFRKREEEGGVGRETNRSHLAPPHTHTTKRYKKCHQIMKMLTLTEKPSVVKGQ